MTTIGEVYGCGKSGAHQLGVVGARIYRSVKIDHLPPIKQVAAGCFHSVFLTAVIIEKILVLQQFARHPKLF